MLISRCAFFFLCFYFCYTQVTIKRSHLLSRKRRYLLFPEGSNFVMTLSVIKQLMIQVPRLVMMLGECDVPFKLPSDPKLIRMHKFHKQRREIHSQFEDAFAQYGLNGKACVKRMICDGHVYLLEKGQSLVSDLLATVFVDALGEDGATEKVCEATVYKDCEISFLNYIIACLSAP